MPIYEYRCQDCRHKVRLFFTYEQYDSAKPVCTYCQSSNLLRLIGRIALGKSEESRLNSVADDSLLSGLDEEDPRALGRFMRKMSSETGEDLGDEFNEVVGRLERGESPDEIEKSMPELASGGDGGGMADEF